MVEPPSELGAVNAMVALVLPAVALSEVTVPGTVVEEEASVLELPEPLPQLASRTHRVSEPRNSEDLNRPASLEPNFGQPMGTY
jgi:hypothetical protein